MPNRHWNPLKFNTCCPIELVAYKNKNVMWILIPLMKIPENT